MSLHISAIVLIPLLVLSAFTGSTHAAATYKSETDDHHLLYVVSIPDNHTAGGARFNAQIGADTAAQTMHAATTFTWSILNQTTNPSEHRKNVKKITLFIDNMKGKLVDAYSTKNEIHVNANFLGSYKGNIRREFVGIVYHQVASIWQWNGGGEAPKGLVSGIAEFVRMNARYGTSEKVRGGDGNRWDEGDGVTCRFLEYCEEVKKGFVMELNRKMRYGYTNAYFVDLLGKSVDQVWKDYKAKYPPKH
ncbi:hypothetical protein LINPERPRIM_LOCUS26438 [Linum perenne]